MMKSLNSVVVSILIMCNTLVVRSQEQVYTLNQYVPLIYQPSYSAHDNDASVSFLNRKTFVTSGVSYQNNMFTAELPFIIKSTGRRFAGIGLHVTQKDAGSTDLLNVVNAGLSVAYSLHVHKHQFISFGMQSVYNDKKTSLESLTTGSQWLAAEFRFDPDADMGETIIENRVRYFGFNAGATWHWQDRLSGNMKARIGLSAFDLNKPNDSFLQGQSKIPISYLANAGVMLYQSRRFEIWPQLYYYHTQTRDALNIALSTKLLFANENPYDIIKSGSIELISQFDFKNDLSLGLALNQPGVSIGFSYNFGIASNAADQPYRNGSEVGIRIFKTLWKPKPATIVIENTSIGTKRNIDFGTRIQEKKSEQSSDVDVIQKNIEDLAKVNSVRFELDKDFKFTFGKSELSPEAKLYLDDIFNLLQKNPEYNLEVIGHTDNVGKPHVNYRLSAARAQAVAQYLIERGVSNDRIKHTGRGDTEPVAGNDTEENRSKNRRVHFIIYVNR